MDSVETGRQLMLEKFDIAYQMDTETVNKFILEKLMELLLVFDNFFGYLEEKWNTVVPAELWHSKIYPWLLNMGLPVVMEVLLLLLLFWVFKILLLCFFRVCNILLMGIFSLGRISFSCCCCCCASETMSTTTTCYDDDEEEEDDYVALVAAKGSAAQVYFKDEFNKPQPPWKATNNGITRNRRNEETYIINCDGSDKPKLGGYYGALIRDSRGDVIAAAAGSSSKPVDITVHELPGDAPGGKVIAEATDSTKLVDITVHELQGLEAKGSAAQVYFKDDFHKPQPPLKAITSGITRNRRNKETYIMNCDGSDKPKLGGSYGALSL